MVRDLLKLLFPSRHPPQEESEVATPQEWLSLDYVHDQVIEQLKAQSTLWDVVDGRLRLILGFIGIVFAAAGGFQRISTPTAIGTAPGSEPALLPFWVGALIVGAVATYLLAGALVACVYWPSRFDWPPKPESLRDEYLTLDPKETKLIVIDSILEAYTRNAAVIERKTLIFKVSFVLTAVATILIGGAIIVQIAMQTKAFGS